MPNSVYFADGYVARNNVVGVAAYLEGYDEEFTRFYMFDVRLQKWGQREFKHQIVSVLYSRNGDAYHSGVEPYTWHLLSKRGVLIQRSQQGTIELSISTAGTGPGRRGYLSRIRAIGGHIYACGFARQVYRLDAGVWRDLSVPPLLSKKETKYSLRDMCGYSEEDIYAVGWLGEVFHFDGKMWTQIQLSTNVDFTSAKCANGQIYIGGKKGTIVIGTRGTWRVFSTDQFVEDIWGVEVYGGLVYLSFLGGLAIFDGTSINRVATGLSPEVGGYHLHANDGILWSFGQEELAYFDGYRWAKAICPDNI